RGVAVAVVVGLVGEAALEQRARAAAGVDAVGRLARAVPAHPAALAAIFEAGAGLARAVAAGAELQVARQARIAAAAGEDLDHPADRLGAVQARARAADDLDALDLRQRQVLDRRHAGGGGIDLDPVHQHQPAVRLRAARGPAAEPSRPA